MIHQNFIYIGALIHLIGGASYIKDTVQGKAQPNRISWGLWAVPVMIAFSAQLSQGVGLQALATFMTGFVPLLVFLASFINKKSYWKLTKFDLMCGSMSLCGLALWHITKSGNMAILFSILADLLAGIPTLKKSFTNPESENWVASLFWLINISLAMLTFKTWTFAYYAFPLYIFLFDLTSFLLVRFELGKRIQVLYTRRLD